MKQKNELFEKIEQQQAKMWDPFYNEDTYKQDQKAELIEIEKQMDRCIKEVEVIERQNYEVPKDFEHVFSNIYSHMDRAIVTKSKPGKPSYYSEKGLMF